MSLPIPPIGTGNNLVDFDIFDIFGKEKNKGPKLNMNGPSPQAGSASQLSTQEIDALTFLLSMMQPGQTAEQGAAQTGMLGQGLSGQPGFSEYSPGDNQPSPGPAPTAPRGPGEGMSDSMIVDTAMEGQPNPNPPTLPGETAPPIMAGPAGPDDGFSANFGADAMEGLSQDPVALTRQWMIQNGMDPDSNNPLAAARRNRGQRAKGTYDLLNRTGEGAGSNPALDQYIDFFSNFMQSGTEAGAAPMLTPEMATQLLSQAVQLAQGGDTFWGGRLGAQNEVDPITGENYTTPEDQAAFMQEMLASAFGGAIDPTMLRAMMEQMDRSQLNFRTGAYTPGEDTGETPAVNNGEDFFDWLVRAGQIPMGIGGQ